MKRYYLSMLALLLTIIILCFSSCQLNTNNTNNNGDETKETTSELGIWENATYLEDKSFGEEGKTIKVEVKANDKTVTFTIKTNKDNLGDALLEYDLVKGEDSAYGLNVTVVNGMTADYNIDKSYWGFYIDNEMAMTGVSGAEIVDGQTYRLEYTK